MKTILMLVAGVRQEGADVELVTNPYSGEVVTEVAVGASDHMDDAIAAAERAFRQTRTLPTHRRADILRGTARRIADRHEELARLITAESGKPIRFARAEVSRAVTTFNLGAAECTNALGQVLPIDLRENSEGRFCFYTRVPRGPVAAIAPFNFPLNLIAHKLAPAIAVGASVVLKPPPQCPITGHVLAELLLEAGLPPEALSVLHCPPAVAQRMVQDPRMKVLSFTGSDTVGWKLKQLAGKKQVLLELGGNAPCIVDETAAVPEIIDEITLGAWANAGQVCIKVQRIYVHESSFDEFLQLFIERTEALGVGDPADEETVVGPLIEKQHVDRIISWIAEAIEGGAVCHSGNEADGQIVKPTIMTGVKPEMKICKEEVFGPVTVVEKFSKFSEVLHRCNETRFGLQAGVFTNDIGRALEAYRTLDYGGVMINDVPTLRVDNFPYGGTKDSGTGREGVKFAMEEMTEPKVMTIR